MLEKLTKEQIARIPEFVDKWTKIGFSTEPANRSLAEEGIKLAYRTAGLQNPKIVWCTSPLANDLTRVIILKGQSGWGKHALGASAGASPADKIWDKVWQSVGTSVEAAIQNSVWPSWYLVKSSVEDSVRASIQTAVGDSVWVKIGDTVWDKWTSIGDAVKSAVWESVEASVGTAVGDSVKYSIEHSGKTAVEASARALTEPAIEGSVFSSVWHIINESVGDSVGTSAKDIIGSSLSDSIGGSGRSIWDSGYGQNDANGLAMYDYLKEVFQLKNETHKLEGLCLQAQSAGWFLPYQNLCWMAERPNILHLKNNRPHCETGPAMVYPDGWSIWALNGVRMNPEYVMTPADKLTPEIALKEINVDQRRELIRKIGVMRLIKHGRVIGILGDYRLVDMSPIFTGIRYAPHLLMKNPSLDDTWHLEGVDPRCHTVQEALNWRAGNMKVNWSPALLS